MHHIDYGLGTFCADAFHDIAPGSTKDLAEIYQNLLCEDQLAAYEINKRFYEIGSVSGIEDLSRALRDGI
jgi:hypothetical protein